MRRRLLWLPAIAMTLTAVAASSALAAGPWEKSGWRYRVAVSVAAAGYERTDKPAEIAIDFTQVLSSLGQSGTLNDNSLRVVEVDAGGNVLDTTVAFQFDRDPDYNPSSKASGTLILILKGVTSSGATRYYHVYFDLADKTFPPPSVANQVTLTDNVAERGLVTYRISTPGNTYYYDKTGGGFLRWLDADGHDWIDWSTAEGDAGDYRGIPNAVFPDGFFHPNRPTSSSSLLTQGPVKVAFRTVSSNNNFECLWEIFPGYARMTMVRASHAFWWLYEGTPGGTLDPSTDIVVRSDGTQTPASDSWGQVLAPESWVYFGDPNVGRSLFAVHHEGDSEIDTYAPATAEGIMTVFGFGRNGINSYISGAPQTFTMGLMGSTAFTASRKTIWSAYKPLTPSVGSAETQPAPATPVLRSPADGTLNSQTDLTVAWGPVPAAASYRLQVATDNGFSAMVADVSGITDTTQLVTGLAHATKHYWRVRAANGTGESAFATAFSFTTRLAVPVLISPAAGATGVPTNPILQWSAVVGATSYHLQMSTSPSFTGGLVTNDSSLTGTSVNLSGLTAGATYYWRVRARGASLAGDFSAGRSFTTIASSPVPLSPVDGAVDQPVSLSLRWTRVAGVSGYHVQLGSDSSFGAGVVVNDSSVTDTTRAVANLAYASRYYWRVAARTSGGRGEFSAARTFQTLLPAPVLVSPSDRTTGLGTTSVMLMWKGVTTAVKYRLQVSTDSLFGGGFIKNDSTIVDTFKAVVALSSGSWYYWRVLARSPSAWSGPSTAWRFRTLGTLPGAVTLVAPAQSAIVSADSIRCVWRKATASPTAYWFTIAADSLFTFQFTDSTIADTSTVYRGLLTSHSYWWKVRARNTEGWGPFGETRTFQVRITDVGPAAEIPREYALEQNYPNPFNPSTVIRYQLPVAGRVRLAVYDLLGREVAVLVDGQKPAGVHSAVFDARRLEGNSSGLPSGIYLYRMTAGDLVFSRKMLLVK
jgi:hypothetical protein